MKHYFLVVRERYENSSKVVSSKVRYDRKSWNGFLVDWGWVDSQARPGKLMA